MHYFDDLAADGACARLEWHRSLVARWIAENPPARGTGWEPYPTSLRLVNWIKAELSGRSLGDAAVDSLAVQARWLRQRLEYHLLGNHLLANAKALVFCGAFFEGDEAARWLAKGLALLRRELAEQVLPDGGHFERSAMYHAVILEDVLDLCQLAFCFPRMFDERDVTHWRGLSQRMLRWLQVMSHPDGEIVFFNDAAMGIAPTLTILSRYARELAIAPPDAPLAAIEILPDSGFVRMSAGPAVLIADVGSVSPDYILGHAHAGTLSFELSLHGQRLIVNSGTSTYERGRERDRQRGSSAHSTIEVDGRNSSEVWAGFRVARRARVLQVRCQQESAALVLEAAHDGYQQQGVGGLHHRCWRLYAEGMEVSDRIEGGGVARFYAHPRVEASIHDGRVLLVGDAAVSIEAEPSGTLQLKSSTWHPRFGTVVDNRVVEIAFVGLCRTRFQWAGANWPAHGG